MPEAVRSFPILFVDDDAPLRQTLSYIVADRLSLATAESGSAALAYLAQHDVAVLLADQRMPTMTGTELCARARSLKPGLVTLITTAYMDLAAIAEAMSLGQVTAYIPKPWTPPLIIDALEFAIDRAAAARGFEERPSWTFSIRRERPLAGNLLPAAAMLEWGPFRVDLLGQRVWVAGNELCDPEPLQVRVLGCLIERAGAIWHRDELCARLYGESSVNPRALSRAIWRLRQKCGEACRFIVSIRGVGYGLGVGPCALENLERTA